MFERQQIEAYQSITAPPELKNRIMETQRRKSLQQSVRFAAAAACLAMVFFFAGLWQDGGAMVSVNGREVRSQAVELAAAFDYGVAMASRARSVEPQLQIPLDVEVKKEAKISVSQGILQTAVEEITDASELKLAESGPVYWILAPDMDNPAICKIATGNKEYTYVVEFHEETNAFIMKQEK